MFPNEISEKLGYYVYRLIDPRNGETFYVGKGKDNRVFKHIAEEIKTNDEGINEKMQRIREIRLSGFKVGHVIHRHGMDELTAFEVEAALIDAYPGISNLSGGRYSDERGVMHSGQIIERYQASETTFKHKVIMITINNSATANNSVYDAVRYAWKLNPDKAKEAELVLAVMQGLVIGVFVPTKWLAATEENFFGRPNRPGRWGFVGLEADEETLKHYMRTRIPENIRKKGAANPVLYKL